MKKKRFFISCRTAALAKAGWAGLPLRFRFPGANQPKSTHPHQKANQKQAKANRKAARCVTLFELASNSLVKRCRLIYYLKMSFKTHFILPLIVCAANYAVADTIQLKDDAAVTGKILAE